jgi:hypothetical protein
MGQLAIVNAPSSFTAIWNVMKPWISKDTQEKVEIFGSDYKSFLLDLIDEENLPESLGGTCKCEHIGGCMNGCEGPWMEGRVWPLKRPLTEPESGGSEKKSEVVDESSTKIREASSEQPTVETNHDADDAPVKTAEENGIIMDEPQLANIDTASPHDKVSTAREKIEPSLEPLPHQNEPNSSSSMDANSNPYQESEESGEDPPSPPGLDQSEDSHIEDPTRTRSPSPLPVPPPSSSLANGNIDHDDSSQEENAPSLAPLPSSSKGPNFLTIPDRSFSSDTTEDSVFYTPSEEVPKDSLAGPGSLDDQALDSTDNTQGSVGGRQRKHASEVEDSGAIATPTQSTPMAGSPAQGTPTSETTTVNPLGVALVDRC